MAKQPESGGKNRAWARFGTRLQVRFSPRGEPESEAEVMDLSGAGVRFSAHEELKQGAVLDFRLMFPGEPMTVRGRVVRVLPREDKGVRFFETAAAFLGLDEAEREEIDMWFYRERIDARVEAHGRGSGGERRRSGRFEVKKAYAEFRRKGFLFSGEWHRGVVRQLSRHGVLLLAKSLLNYGDRVEALLYLPAYEEAVRTVASVVRVKSKDAGLPLFYRHEIGLEFIKISKADLKKLSEDEYLQNLAENSAGGPG